ncbi:MAG: AAA family ATPase [Bacteroidia bacterium]
MIVKKISIQNYLCYYDVNDFDLSDGLNIILGENGEGKTKFFEALDWLFDGSDDKLDLLVSAKALEETPVGESFGVKVSIIVEQNGEKKIITKSFLAKKEKANECSTSNYMLDGIEENKSGERVQVDGKQLLDRIFPFQIRKYSMFKGEADLDIFKSEDALTNLINLFSDAKHYEKYSEKGALLRDKAEKAVEESSKADTKNEALYKKLESEIQQLENEKYRCTVHLTSTENEIRKIEGNIQAAGSYVKNAAALETINTRIKNIDEKISSLYGNIDENYTTSLFDQNWISVNFESIHHEFAEKISKLSIARRKQQSEFDKQKGIKEGEAKAKAELLNNSIPLPIGIPSKAHMEEMLEAQLCKVCNREALKGSEPYDFMMKRLKEYLTSQAHKEEGEKSKPEEHLYKKDYTNRLVSMSVSHEDNLKNLRGVRTTIKDLFKYNDERKKDIEQLNEKLEKEKLERAKILGNSSIAEEKLIDVLKNYNVWQDDLKQRNGEQNDYNTRLKNVVSDLKAKREDKDKIDLNSAKAFLIKTRAILRDIETIFKETKEMKFDEFIEKLQTKSNSFFSRINIDSFTGNIVFNKRTSGNKTVVDIELQEDGRIFYKPNQSLLTSMHISILFAISELASETREEKYPMIFDAPTSSFGENKSAEFLNLIHETQNQKILLIKDFLATDKKTKALSIKKEFETVKRNKAFWVKLERPFDPQNLKTINTKVITL